jgi:signal transduction histidine kinase
MRRRLIVISALVTAIALVVLGAPLAVFGARAIRADAQRLLDRDTDALGFALEESIEGKKPVDRVTLGVEVQAGRYVVVVDLTGTTTTQGRPIYGRTLSATTEPRPGASVTLVESYHDVHQRVLRLLWAIAALGVGGLMFSAVAATWLSRRISLPMARLAEVSEQLGDGDFTARAEESGIREIDDVVSALNSSATRIEELVGAEREFASNASHQLRTPLTALRLHLEELELSVQDPAARDEVQAAVAQADRLQATIEDLLVLARQGRMGPASRFDVVPVIDAELSRWRHSVPDRAIVRTGDQTRTVTASRPCVVHVLDVLIDNAVRHGGGTITLDVQAVDDLVAITVTDEGAGVSEELGYDIFIRRVSGHGGTGIGLALARILAESSGGRLDLVAFHPASFRLLLPATGPVTPIDRRRYDRRGRTS